MSSPNTILTWPSCFYPARTGTGRYVQALNCELTVLNTFRISCFMLVVHQALRYFTGTMLLAQDGDKGKLPS